MVHINLVLHIKGIQVLYVGEPVLYCLGEGVPEYQREPLACEDIAPEVVLKCVSFLSRPIELRQMVGWFDIPTIPCPIIDILYTCGP